MFFVLFLEMNFSCLLVVLAVGFSCGEKETDKHGAGHKPPSHMHHDHEKDGEHNSHYDHEAVLGIYIYSFILIITSVNTYLSKPTICS